MKFFSIIIPVNGTFRKRKFPNFCEVIYVDKYKKSTARNWGSKKAHCKYLIHIDKDNIISDKVLIKAKELIKKTGVKAIVLEEYIKNPINIWQKARSLERKILAGNEIMATPQIIEKKLFNKVGGYDERFNELDDWALYMRLQTVHCSPLTVHNATSIYEPTNIFQIIKRRFKKGRELKYFKEVYGDIPQTKINNILNSYIKNPPSVSLLILKFFDWVGLFLGSLFPVRPNIDKLYQDKLVAKNFNRKQNSIYGRLKNYLEIYSLFQMLPPKSKVLDLGAGTGRITKELVKRKFKVTPADISLAMISQFPKSLPKPILLKSNKLPFKNNSFDTVLSMRVIWHIKDNKLREKFFSEAVRVTKNNIIMDFSFFGSPSDHQFTWSEIKKLIKNYKYNHSSNVKIINYYYLPLGRLLINFKKS